MKNGKRDLVSGNRMNIAIMTGSLSKGGTERVIVNLTDYLVEKGDSVSIVSLLVAKEEYKLNTSAKRYIWDLTENETKSGRIARISNFKARVDKLNGIWDEIKPDLVLSFIGKNNIMALLTAKRRGIPVIVAVRGEPKEEYYAKWMQYAARHMFKRADKVVLQTKGQQEFFPETIKNKSVILKNPLNTQFLIDPVPFDEREPLIVSVGRIDANKNHRMIIDAFSNIRSEFPEYKLVIYGDGELREELTEYVKSLHMDDYIKLPGRIDDVPNTIKKARVFVLSSDTEGSPNALIEAMCLSICCISTDCPSGGPGELIKDRENGLLIPVRNTPKMQDVLQKLLNNLHEAERIAMNASTTRDIYNPETVLDEWRKTLKGVVNTGNRDK
ncbi:MAG: glycosyltransferase [Lachnospiraceae bacterium]|nr:glycosyltransferase [Lachnospiraceae bacterium]